MSDPGSAAIDLSQAGGVTTPTEIVIIFTLDREAAPFRRDNPGAHVVISGIGRSMARLAAQTAVKRFQPRLVISAGFCGALVPHLAVGDIIASPRIVTVNELVATPESKRQLAAGSGAEAVDMESAEVAAVCAEQGVDCLAVRAVSDTVDTALSPELARLLSGGHVSPWRAMKALLQRPRLLGEFRRLARDTNVAAQKLADELVRIVTARRR